jgi:RNA polymerase sigma-70 factor (ECF subfamily)
VSEEAEAALAAMFRQEWPRLVGAALRITADLQAAEDSVQETLLVALDRWPLQGVPDRPGAWLMTVCRNRARNLVRDSGRAAAGGIDAAAAGRAAAGRRRRTGNRR